MFSTVGDKLQCRNGQITVCKEMLHFVAIWEKLCLLEFYLKEKKKKKRIFCYSLYKQ